MRKLSELEIPVVDLSSMGIDAEKELIKILNREICKEIAKESFENQTQCDDEVVAINMRVHNLCMEGLDIEGAMEAILRVIQVRMRQINIKHCE